MIKQNRFLLEFPNEGSVWVSEGQTLLDATLSVGIPLFHVCGGNARCSTCRVLIINGAESLTAPNEKETLLKNEMHFPPNVRLSCQTYLTGGGVKLRRIIQDETDIGLYVGSAAGYSTQQLGEERELVLLFLDIRDFTPFVKKHLAFDIIHIIRKLFSVFQAILETNGGKIIETAGDGLYAIFSCESNRVQSVQSAVQSGFSILADLEVLNETYFGPHFHEKIQVGIGIHIGKVISGSIQIGKEDRLVVMGYPVNVASRLQNATKELNNNFIISAAAYSLLPTPTEQAVPYMIHVKGIEQPLSGYLIGYPFV
jgi:adenylate cyclase